MVWSVKRMTLNNTFRVNKKIIRITFPPKHSLKCRGFSSFQPNQGNLILVSSFLIQLPSSQLEKFHIMDGDSVILHIEGSQEVVRFSMEIPSAATFRQLKEKIQEKTGVTVDRQLILAKDGRVPMDDNSTLESRGFKHLAEVVLVVTPLPQGTQINITISIPPGTNDLNLRVEDKQTVLELKKKICSFYNNLHPDRFRLFHLFTEMMNSHPLYEYFVNEGSNIIMLKQNEGILMLKN